MTRNRAVPDISPEDTAFVRAMVLHEDNSLIVFNKPAGLAVQAGSAVKSTAVKKATIERAYCVMAIL